MITESITFSFNKDGIITCVIKDETGKVTLKGTKAIRALKCIDELNFVGMQFNKGNIHIYDKDSRIVFENYNEFFSSGYLDYCPYTKEVIMNAYRKYRAKKSSNTTTKKKKAKLKPGVKKVLITSALILAILGVSKGLGSAALNNYPESMDINSQQIQQVIENNQNDYMDEVYIEDYNIGQSYTGQVEEKDDTVYFEDAEDRSMSQKAVQAREWYGTVTKYANRYGISPNLPMAVLTQESGGDNSFRDGLMQIQFWSWKDQPVRAYNFETNETETIVLTDTPSKYSNSGYTVYTRDDLKRPDINIKCGIIFLRYSILNVDNNIVYGTFAYNMGVTNIVNLIERYVAQNPDLTFEEVIEDSTHINNLIDLARQTINVGDPDYLNNVVQYAEGDEFSIKVFDENNNIVVNTVEFEQGPKLGH